MAQAYQSLPLTPSLVWSPGWVFLWRGVLMFPRTMTNLPGPGCTLPRWLAVWACDPVQEGCPPSSLSCPEPGVIWSVCTSDLRSLLPDAETTVPALFRLTLAEFKFVSLLFLMSPCLFVLNAFLSTLFLSPGWEYLHLVGRFDLCVLEVTHITNALLKSRFPACWTPYCFLSASVLAFCYMDRVFLLV